MFTAATWFHRFYMRYSMEDFHRQVRYFDQLTSASKRYHFRMLQHRAYFLSLKLKNVAESSETWQEFAKPKFKVLIYPIYPRTVK